METAKLAEREAAKRQAKRLRLRALVSACLLLTKEDQYTPPMSRPLVIAHHLVFTIYGVWPPNDPRGSSSHEIRNEWIADLGELHHGRKIEQPTGADLRAFQREAASRLKHTVRELNDRDVELVAESIGAVIARERYTCWACVIMPDHVHLLIRKHKDQAEQMLEKIQGESRSRLRASSPPPSP